MRTIVLLLVSVHLVAQDQPIKFRGAYIGQPLSDWVDCSSGKGKSLKDGYKAKGKVCEGGSGVVERLKYHTGMFKAPTEEGELLRFENRKLTSIKIFVPNDDWEKIRYDLSQKLGDPLSEIPQVYQNAFGARYEYAQGFWQKADLVAYAKVKVHAFLKKPLSNTPETQGIEVTITDAEHAKLPETQPSTLD